MLVGAIHVGGPPVAECGRRSHGVATLPPQPRQHHVTHEAESTSHLDINFNHQHYTQQQQPPFILSYPAPSQWQLLNRPPHYHIPLDHTSTSSSQHSTSSTFHVNPHTLISPSPHSQPHQHSNNASKPQNGLYITSSNSTTNISNRPLPPPRHRCIYSHRHSPFPPRLHSIH